MGKKSFNPFLDASQEVFNALIVQSQTFNPFLDASKALELIKPASKIIFQSLFGCFSFRYTYQRFSDKPLSIPFWMLHDILNDPNAPYVIVFQSLFGCFAPPNEREPPQQFIFQSLFGCFPQLGFLLFLIL